jgi:hypothetical protein
MSAVITASGHTRAGCSFPWFEAVQQAMTRAGAVSGTCMIKRIRSVVRSDAAKQPDAQLIRVGRG